MSKQKTTPDPKTEAAAWLYPDVKKDLQALEKLGLVRQDFLGLHLITYAGVEHLKHLISPSTPSKKDQ